MSLHSLKSRMGRAAEQAWNRLPANWRESAPLIAAGSCIHAASRRFSTREQSESTWFLRNEALFLTLRDLVTQTFPPGEQVRLCVAGCSTGAEIYSFLWALRKVRPDSNICPLGFDISGTAVAKANAGRYTRHDSEIVRGFLGSQPVPLPDETIRELFEIRGDELTIKDWVRQGARFQVADARDPELALRLGPQDVLVANNFLVHMKPPAAKACLQNLIRLVRPGGIFVCRGVDLDVREQAVRQFGLAPVATRIEEIHNSELDVDARHWWPWRYFGLEPMNKRRKNWIQRYASIFRVPTPPQVPNPAPGSASGPAVTTPNAK